MSNTVMKHAMELVKVELDSDNESQPEISCTKAQQADLKQENHDAPFVFVAVTEVVSVDDTTFIVQFFSRVVVVSHINCYLFRYELMYVTSRVRNCHE
jgi:hypothetical protein